MVQIGNSRHEHTCRDRERAFGSHSRGRFGRIGAWCLRGAWLFRDNAGEKPGCRRVTLLRAWSDRRGVRWPRSAGVALLRPIGGSHLPFASPARGLSCRLAAVLSRRCHIDSALQTCLCVVTLDRAPGLVCVVCAVAFGARVVCPGGAPKIGRRGGVPGGPRHRASHISLGHCSQTFFSLSAIYST